jgi:hypothetical protein
MRHKLRLFAISMRLTTVIGYSPKHWPTWQARLAGSSRKAAQRWSTDNRLTDNRHPSLGTEPIEHVTPAFDHISGGMLNSLPVNSTLVSVEYSSADDFLARHSLGFGKRIERFVKLFVGGHGEHQCYDYENRGVVSTV